LIDVVKPISGAYKSWKSKYAGGKESRGRCSELG